MVMIEGVFWYLFLLDAVGANITAWFCADWFKKNFKGAFWKHLPLTKGWSVVYLVLVLWVGYGLLRLGII